MQFMNYAVQSLFKNIQANIKDYMTDWLIWQIQLYLG